MLTGTDIRKTIGDKVKSGLPGKTIFLNLHTKRKGKIFCTNLYSKHHSSKSK